MYNGDVRVITSKLSQNNRMQNLINNMPEGTTYSEFLDYDPTTDVLNDEEVGLLGNDPFDEFDIDPIEVDGEGEEVFE